MSIPNKSGEELARRAHDLYDQKIREEVEPGHNGEFLVIDVETGDYEVDADEMTALDRAHARHPSPSLFLMRVGYPTAHRIGRPYLRSGR
jgi:transcriptional antiterminator Rof (Rho-off)